MNFDNQKKKVILVGGYTTKHLLLRSWEFLKKTNLETIIYISPHFTESIDPSYMNLKWGQTKKDFPKDGVQYLYNSEMKLQDELTVEHLKNFNLNWIDSFQRNHENSPKMYFYELGALNIEPFDQEKKFKITGKDPKTFALFTQEYFRSEILIFVDCRCTPRSHRNPWYNIYSRTEAFLQNPKPEISLDIIIIGGGPSSVWVAEACIDNDIPFKFLQKINFTSTKKNPRNAKTAEILENNQSRYFCERDSKGFTPQELCSKSRILIRIVKKIFLTSEMEEEVGDKIEEEVEEDCDLSLTMTEFVKFFNEEMNTLLQDVGQKENAGMVSLEDSQALEPFKARHLLVKNSIEAILQIQAFNPKVQLSQLIIITDSADKFIRVGVAVLCIGYDPIESKELKRWPEYQAIAINPLETKDISPIPIQGSVYHQLCRGSQILFGKIGVPGEEILKRNDLDKLFITDCGREFLINELKKSNIVVDDNFFSQLKDKVNNLQIVPTKQEAKQIFLEAYENSIQSKESLETLKGLLQMWIEDAEDEDGLFYS